VTARAARDDDLKVRFLAHAARVAGSLFVAAETATSRGGALSCSLLVHDATASLRLDASPSVVWSTRASNFDSTKRQARMQVARLLGVCRLLGAALLIAGAAAAPLRAERQIVDLHRLDANFQLFAADSSVPWKGATVRLDTYSSAPVAFAVYRVDPADVLTAGSNFSARAIATQGRRSISSFTFMPPGGYQFQSNAVNLPLGSREGFFVVEARRGDVGEQVWINRSRIGLIAKQTPNGVLLYGADLGTGMPMPRMRVQLVVDRNFVTTATDAQGIVRWNRQPRPVFALAQWGASYAFLSLLPQPPLPATIVGVRTDSAVVHAGGIVRVAGFARTRFRGILRASSGNALISLRDGATVVAEQRVPLDAAGAFATSFALPENAAAGEYSVLAQAAGGVGGATVDVDANAGGLSLEVNAACNGRCDSRADVPLIVHSSRPQTSVRVLVVRSPHIDAGEAPEAVPWGTTLWLESTVRTGDNGIATIEIPRPNDELGSTYGVHVEAEGATADTRVVVPTADAIIRVIVSRAEQSLGTPLRFDVYAASLDSKPLAGAVVTVDLTHGVSASRQQLTLDGEGHAAGAFSTPQLGTNFLVAWVDRGGRATDAAQVLIDPQGAQPASDAGSGDVRIGLDRTTYRAGELVGIDATAPGAQGAALITLESELGIETHVVKVGAGRAAAGFRAVDAAGEVRAGAAFVRDGALEWSALPVSLAAPGRPRAARFRLAAAQYAPGALAKIAIDDAGGGGTYVIRISRGAPSGSALFASAPALLAIGVTSTQDSAPEAVTWHPWVRSTGDRAQVLGFVRRTQPPPELSLSEADTEAVSWQIVRGDGERIAVALPESSGRYDLSVLAIAEDGSVSAASSSIVVR
jgi:hypothetical protein